MGKQGDILDYLYEATGSDQMSKEEAIDLIRNLIKELHIQMETLEDELDG